MNILELSEQEIVRRGSLDEMRRMGIDPYPAALYPTDAYTTEIKETFSDDAPQREVCIAGRIMSRRIMGKASFMELRGLERPHSSLHKPRRPLSRRRQGAIQCSVQKTPRHRRLRGSERLRVPHSDRRNFGSRPRAHGA